MKLSEQYIELRLATVVTVHRLLDMKRAKTQKEALQQICHIAGRKNIPTGFDGDSFPKIYNQYRQFCRAYRVHICSHLEEYYNAI